jgi:hypothetical protein
MIMMASGPIKTIDTAGPKQAIAVRELDAAAHFTPQHDQLMSECRVLCLKSAFSASSRRFDLNGEVNRVRKKHNRAIIAAGCCRFQRHRVRCEMEEPEIYPRVQA